MTGFGSIVSYDPLRRAGMIKPETGGDPILFTLADQTETFKNPRPFERYSYSLQGNTDGGQQRAVNLLRTLSHREQAEAQAG